MRRLGIKVDYESETGYYQATMDAAPEGAYRFEKPSHTGTELLMMLGVMTGREVTIEGAATEPEIDDLISFLKEGGADIEKKGDKIIIKKSAPLRQKTPFKILTDRNELVTYATLSVASGGEIEIGPVSENIIASFLEVMKKANVGVEKIKEDTFRFFYKGKILPVVIETSPHPGFMTDWQPNFAVMLLKANGVAQITERIFENRFSYVEELKKLGAKIEYSQTVTNDPEKYFYFNWKPGKIYNQTIKIHGGQTLHNGVLTIKDLRAGAALACAALLVDGESIVNGVSQLERGYEDFVGKIKDLGGEIIKI
jgi:UDP-N-acetylglucosamine 1-carboxyvinyltransferase